MNSRSLLKQAGCKRVVHNKCHVRATGRFLIQARSTALAMSTLKTALVPICIEDVQRGSKGKETKKRPLFRKNVFQRGQRSLLGALPKVDQLLCRKIKCFPSSTFSIYSFSNIMLQQTTLARIHWALLFTDF
jgi:hypothetical protein